MFTAKYALRGGFVRKCCAVQSNVACSLTRRSITSAAGGRVFSQHGRPAAVVRGSCRIHTRPDDEVHNEQLRAKVEGRSEAERVELAEREIAELMERARVHGLDDVRDQVRALNDVGLMYAGRGELPMGSAFFQRALELARSAFRERFASVELAIPSREVEDLLSCLRNVAVVHERSRRYEVVAVALDESVELLRVLTRVRNRKTPESLGERAPLLDLLCDQLERLGIAYHRTGRSARAVAALDEAVALREKTMATVQRTARKRNPMHTERRREAIARCAAVLNLRGRVQRESSNAEGAVLSHLRAVEAMRDGPRPLPRLDMALSQQLLAMAHVLAGDVVSAKAAVRGALRTVNAEFPSGEHPAVVAIYRVAADIFERTEQWGVAIRHKRRELECLERLVSRQPGSSDEHPRVKAVRAELGHLQQESRNSVNAIHRRWRLKKRRQRNKAAAANDERNNDKSDDDDDDNEEDN